MGKITELTELFNFGLATGIGEKKSNLLQSA